MTAKILEGRDLLWLFHALLAEGLLVLGHAHSCGELMHAAEGDLAQYLIARFHPADSETGTAFLGDMEENWFLGISPNAFGAVGALVNFAVAFLVSNFTEPPPEDVQELVESIRVPKGAGTATDH